MFSGAGSLVGKVFAHIASCFCTHPYMQLALTCWIGVVLHDFWFFVLHHALHKNKTLYRK